MTKKELLESMGFEDSVVFESPSYDDAIIGISNDDCVIYDYDKMVDCFMKEHQCDEVEAADFISYNTIRALDYFTGDKKPIIMYRLDEE